MSDADLRYPIGKFTFPDSVSRADLEGYIAEIADLPQHVRAAVWTLSDERLDTPYRPGGWTVRQVVHHLADSHMNAYVRLKVALTEDNPTIKPYDEQRWAELSEARTGPAGISLGLLDGLHLRWAMTLSAMKEEDFARTFHHPALGQVRLDVSTAMYAWHGRHHLMHITHLAGRMGW